jgi:hypothetical protein
MRESQKRWNNAVKGRWTRTLIPNLEPWVERKHGATDFHLTYTLSGHGCFAEFLHRIRKANSPECWFCDAELDDADHTLFHCERWDQERWQLMRETTEWPTRDNFVNILLRTKEDWEAASKYVRVILKAKEEFKRERDKLNGNEDSDVQHMA